MTTLKQLTHAGLGCTIRTSKQTHALLARGAAGGLFFATDDIHRSYEELKGRGVEFLQEPTEQPYGIDAGFRDPSGNQFRLAQQK
jgi:predicted enzyme related to lactoylglutathione lyase